MASTVQTVVDSTSIRDKARTLRQYNSTFDSQISSLVGTEQSLNSMWDGEANDKFHEEFIKDKDKMIKFRDLITKYAEALEQIATNYEQAECTNSSTASMRTY